MKIDITRGFKRLEKDINEVIQLRGDNPGTYQEDIKFVLGDKLKRTKLIVKGQEVFVKIDKTLYPKSVPVNSFIYDTYDQVISGTYTHQFTCFDEVVFKLWLLPALQVNGLIHAYDDDGNNDNLFASGDDDLKPNHCDSELGFTIIDWHYPQKYICSDVLNTRVYDFDFDEDDDKAIHKAIEDSVFFDEVYYEAKYMAEAFREFAESKGLEKYLDRYDIVSYKLKKLFLAKKVMCDGWNNELKYTSIDQDGCEEFLKESIKWLKQYVKNIFINVADWHAHAYQDEEETEEAL